MNVANVGAEPEPSAPISFDTVVCGLDTSPESKEAAKQAATLAAEGAQLSGVSVWDAGLAMRAGVHVSRVMAELRADSVSALRDAEQAIPGLRMILVKGPEVAGLLGAVANLEADLLAVGARGSSRAAGVVFGSVATAMAHHVPCSVLIARPAPSEPFPSLILHASDGSSGSLDAAYAAGEIAARRDVRVISLHVAEDPASGQAVVESTGSAIEAGGRAPEVEVRAGSPQTEIVARADELQAGLVVIGSRGQTGLKALGSVSERVAHRSPCSVLIVRRPLYPSRDDRLEP
jgi:nucleotide-binding universal stress UspA family protein